MPWQDVSLLRALQRRDRIHTYRVEDEAELSEQLRSMGFDIYVINGSSVRCMREFFAESAEVLEFPEWFGHNWDAFYDCLDDAISDGSPNVALLWTNASVLLSANEGDFLRCVVELCETTETYRRDPGQVVQFEVFFGAIACLP